MKNTSNSLAFLGILIYGMVMLGCVLLIILGIEEFVTVMVPQLIEAVNPF